jgi:hypothetical protein
MPGPIPVDNELLRVARYLYQEQQVAFLEEARKLYDMYKKPDELRTQFLPVALRRQKEWLKFNPIFRIAKQDHLPSKA